MAQASRRASPAGRRVVAIKRADGEPLTRVDIQYEFLQAVFNDSQEVFTDPYGPKKVTFRELYTKAILNSPKATKALKDKMNESPIFALDFAMLSLLVNVGRVNTTMSFFPEMKTAIRTYHPIPSLQHTTGNMQDAPRIKHILKTSLLELEAKHPPATPADILVRCKAGKPPSTSVTNLVFVLAHHTGPIGHAHFQGVLDFLDLFLRTDVSSPSRAKAFLWLCFNYLEAPSAEDDYDEEPVENPFSDPSKKASPPSFVYLNADEMASENQESPEDKLMSEKLITQRNRIVQTQGAKDLSKSSNKASVNGSVLGDDDDTTSLPPEESKGKGKRAQAISNVKGGRPQKERKLPKTKEQGKEREPTSHLAVLDDGSDDNLVDAFMKKRALPRNKQQPSQLEHSLERHPSANGSHPTYRHILSPGRTNGTPHQRYSPYRFVPSATKELDRPHFNYRSRHVAQPRTMLQQAWHTIASTDPLIDSDDERGGDEHVREDYVQRLRVIDRLSRQQWSQDQSSYSLEMDTDL